MHEAVGEKEVAPVRDHEVAGDTEVARVPAKHCGSRDPRDEALDMKAVTPAIARYFSGYTWKMHPLGERQIKQLREDIERRVTEVRLPILTDHVVPVALHPCASCASSITSARSCNL